MILQMKTNNLTGKRFHASYILAIAMMMFSQGLPRRDHFWRRLLLWGPACLLTAAAIPIVTDGLWYVTTDAGRTILDIRSEQEGTP